jgi:hypothetical protein
MTEFNMFARNRPELLRYLPDEDDWRHLDKKWVCDILFTRDAQGVQLLINNAKEDRRKRLDQSQGQLVEMRPEFAQALRRCTTFSSKSQYRVTQL